MKTFWKEMIEMYLIEEYFCHCAKVTVDALILPKETISYC